MGVNALNRSDKDTVSAVWFKKENINSTTGVATRGKHIKVKFEEKRSKALSQPIRNLMTDESATVVSTKFNYDYDKFDEIMLNGARWQILDQQIEYIGEQANALVNPRLQSVTYLALTQLGGKKLWKTK